MPVYYSTERLQYKDLYHIDTAENFHRGVPLRVALYSLRSPSPLPFGWCLGRPVTIASRKKRAFVLFG